MFYPDQARYARLAAESLGLSFTDLDGGNGYVFAVSDGARRVLAGAGLICSYPVNSASSFNISRDKAHTKSVLRHAGMATIEGRHFFLSDSHAALRNPGHEPADALQFAQALGFPVFCKPNRGARGDFAEHVADATALTSYMGRVAQKYDSFLIEPVVSGIEYRVLLYRSTPICYVRKTPPCLVGDGLHTVLELLARLNLSIKGIGVSPYPVSAIVAGGVEVSYVAAIGERIPIVGRQNLTAAGGIDHLDTNVPEALYRIAVGACAAVGLCVGAVDIFDVSIARDLSDLVVIEVNGNPALKSLELSGRIDVIVDLWKRMLLEQLSRSHAWPG